MNGTFQVDKYRTQLAGRFGIEKDANISAPKSPAAKAKTTPAAPARSTNLYPAPQSRANPTERAPFGFLASILFVSLFSLLLFPVFFQSVLFSFVFLLPFQLSSL